MQVKTPPSGFRVPPVGAASVALFQPTSLVHGLPLTWSPLHAGEHFWEIPGRRLSEFCYFTTFPYPDFHKTSEKTEAVKNQTERSNEKTWNTRVIKYVFCSRFFSSSQVACVVSWWPWSPLSEVQRLDFCCFLPLRASHHHFSWQKKNRPETNKIFKTTCLLKTCSFLWLSQGQGAQGN